MNKSDQNITQSDNIDPLVRQLTRAARRRFDRYDLHQGSYKPIPYEEIAELQELAFEYTKTSPNSLKRGRRIEKLIDGASRHIENPAHKDRIRRRLFGVDEGWTKILTTRELHDNYTSRKPDEQHRDPSTLYERDQEALTSLAQAIRQLMSNSRERAEQESRPLISGRPYISRAYQEIQFAAMVKRGIKIIVLYGQAGMGKTWLSRALTMKGEQEAPRIRFTDGKMNVIDLDAALLRIGVAPAELTVMTPTNRLSLLLCGPMAPEFVVLDNLETTRELQTLIPANIVSTIIVTSRIRGPAHEDYGFIRVTTMSDDEAVDLIKSRLTDADTDGATQLANSFGNFPLVLQYACVLIEARMTSIAAISREWTASIATSFIEGIVTSDGAPLHSILEEILVLVMRENILAYRLIEAVALLRYIPVWPVDMLERYLQVNFGLAADPIRFGRVLDTLRNASLIETIDLGSITSVSIHVVVLTILRDIFKGTAATFAKAIGKTADSYPTRSGAQHSDEVSPDQILIEGFAIFNAIAAMGHVLIDNEAEASRYSMEEKGMYEHWLAAYLIQFDKMRFSPKFVEAINKAGGYAGFPDHWVDWARTHRELEGTES